jgi:hypothetical protein
MTLLLTGVRPVRAYSLTPDGQSTDAKLSASAYGSEDDETENSWRRLMLFSLSFLRFSDPPKEIMTMAGSCETI